MDKYNRVLKTYNEFKNAVCSLNKTEFEKLILGLELSIWKDKVSKLEQQKGGESK